MAQKRTEVQVDVGGRKLALSNLGKVLFPESGVTKAAVIDYYRRIAPTMLPYLAGRPLTMVRFPDGIEGERFFEKRCPSHAPEWMARVTVPERGNGTGEITHCAIEDLPSLVWAANLASLEIHVPMGKAADYDHPTTVVFDFDPGPPAHTKEAATIALAMRDLLADLGLQSFPKVSGKKGVHLYVPLNLGKRAPHHDTVREFAKAAAQLVEKRRPKEVVTSMRKDIRKGKVLIDWSQNHQHKTTVAPYSMRAVDPPSVSAPVTWEEVEALAGGERLVFSPEDVLARVDDIGDLFAPVLELRQELDAALSV